MSLIALPALLGVHAGMSVASPEEGVLISEGAIHAPLALLRAQVNSRATAFGSDDATIQAFGADVPRFSGSGARLVVEGQRTNDIVDPIDFTSAGGWTTQSGGSGSAPVVTPNYGAIAAPDGSFTATRLQLDRGPGTASTDFSGLQRSTSTSAARHVWIRTLGGTASVQIGTTSTTAGSQSSVDATWRRLGVSAGGALHRIMLNGGAGNSATADLLVWGASSETNSAFPSTLVLPPVGLAQASTRGADLVNASLVALGLPASCACTVLWSGRLPQLPTGTGLTILQIDDGTNTVRWVVDKQPANGNIRIYGTGSTSVLSGTATVNAPLRLALAIDGAGRAAASLNGGAVVAATGGPSAGFTTFRLGTNASGSLGMFGETAYLRVIPTVTADADLPAASLVLPG
ncbi:hypothetical protein [Roseomonas sp. AR75]|uniref:hypothetical protein n=1 Tax=Roseomonas sp. AR75 TaxID=2562311 RepID=UPI0010C01F72|nr:hypothetical protein [Roseomonas sp. AR75]